MADFNMNTKLLELNAINGFVRENLVQPLQKSQKVDTKVDNKGDVDGIQRQEIASEPYQSDVANEKEMPKEELDDTIRELNDSLQNVQKNLEFSIDKDAGRIVISVKDKLTDEVLRQIPSEEVLELARNLHNVSISLNLNISERNSESYSSQSPAEGVFLKTSV